MSRSVPVRAVSAAAPVDALQAALAGEHAAVWACGRAAGELSGASRTGALEELDAHRAARDALAAQIEAAGETPVEAAPAYVEPFPVTGARSARRLLAHVNEGLVAAYADLAAGWAAGARGPAIAAAVASGRRVIGWGGTSSAFPGSA